MQVPRTQPLLDRSKGSASSRVLPSVEAGGLYMECQTEKTADSVQREQREEEVLLAALSDR